MKILDKRNSNSLKTFKGILNTEMENNPNSIYPKTNK